MFTTKEKIKQRLQIDENDSNVDDLIENLIGQATQRIEQYCNREFESKKRAGIYLTAYSPYILRPDVTPIESIQSIETTTDYETWQEVDKSKYTIVDTIIRLTNGTLPTGNKRVRLAYTAGYTIDFDGEDHTLPADIQEVCEHVVIREYNKRSTEGQTSTSFGESRTTWGKSLNAEDRETLDKYRVPPVP